jgi:hypothetical protein
LFIKSFISKFIAEGMHAKDSRKRGKEGRKYKWEKKLGITLNGLF